MILAIVPLESGRVLRLRQVEFHETYGELVMGVPTEGFNAGLLRRHTKTMEEMAYNYNTTAYMVAPEVQMMTFNKQVFPQFPVVFCMGLFDSAAIAMGDMSRAVIGWYQDTMGPPVFRSVPWETFAEDGEF